MNPAQSSEVQGRLRDKVALVTGGASGIGRETALLFTREGARVAIGDIDLPGAGKAAAEVERLGAEPLVVSLDVTSETDWSEAIDRVQQTWGRFDILVNSVGITDDAPLRELSLKQWRHVLTTNLEGTFLGTAAALRAMASAGRGSIVNVASVSGIQASAGAAAYCASKAAVIQLSRVAALECAEAGHSIRVNCVVPGGVKTPMWEKSPLWPEISFTPEWKAPPEAPARKRFAQPIEVARAILFLASDEASYVSGSALVVDGSATA
jgi:NAD(P)-dependent dehydrogenase (short-subunit alcohol dehydrogenase family)